MTTMTLKEEKDYTALKLKIAKVDMERAALIKELRAKPIFALETINDRLKQIVGKYFSTPNSELIYTVISGTAEYTLINKSSAASERKLNKIVNTKSSQELVPTKAREYVVVLNIVKYDRTGKSIDSVYKINSSELPKDVDKWLYMGNAEISKGEAKDYLTKALNAEKKALEARIKEINLIIK